MEIFFLSGWRAWPPRYHRPDVFPPNVRTGTAPGPGSHVTTVEPSTSKWRKLTLCTCLSKCGFLINYRECYCKFFKKHIVFIYIVIDEEIKMNFNFIFTYKKPKMFCIHIPHSRINTSTWGMTHGVWHVSTWQVLYGALVS